MKNIYIKYFLVLALVSFGFTGCEDDDTLPVDFEDLNASGGAFAAEVSTTGSTDINRNNPSESVFQKTYVIDSPQAGNDVTEVQVFVSYSGSNEVLYETIPSSEFSSGPDGLPQFTVNFDGAAILSALGLQGGADGDLEGGATFRYRLALVTPRGTFTDVSPNFANQSANHTFSSTVVCLLPEVPAGDWKINMADSFGDGWQTNDASGGDGLTITLSNGDEFEVGLCNPYVPVGYSCVDDYDSGTATISIPEGVESAEWFFPGDFYGEISFEIIAPSGNVVASVEPGAGAGVVALNLCNE